MALNNYFQLSERGTNIKREIIAGCTSFVTIAYILAVNPAILSASGMPAPAVFTSTALIGCVGTLLMGLLTNYPFVIAPSMGLNAYFAYTVCLTMGYSWEVGLAAIVLEGILFLIISMTQLREWLFNAIPFNLKMAITVGIGLFITIIGLKNSGIMIPHPKTYVSMISFHQSYLDGTFATAGITAILSAIGIILTAVFICNNVKGNILLGILSTWILGMVCEVYGLYIPDPEAGYFSVIPDFSQGLFRAPLSEVAFHLDFSQVANVGFIVVVIAFLFTNLFDTLGTLIATGSKAELLDEECNLPELKGCLLAQSLTIICCGFLGTSPTAVCVESAAGISEGGRTGLASVVTALLFLLSLFLAPIFLAIPAWATAPALIIVGFLMMTAISQVDLSDFTEAIPAFFTFIAMPFYYSIAEGISAGIISYVIINTFTGKVNRTKVSPVMWVLAGLMLLKYFFI